MSTASTTTDPRFPIGPFTYQGPHGDSERRRMIREIAAQPERLRAAVAGLSDAQLDTPYREGGWTARQVAHHLPDSHMNAFIRLKLALTEDTPTIKPYDESAWAKLADARMPIEVSLVLLDAVHRRWVELWNAMSPADWSRTFRHPERGVMDLDQLLALYCWHGSHHVAHITALRARMGW